MAAAAAAFLALALALALLLQSEAQQSYVNNKQLKCDESPNITLGFVCNAAAPSCTSYLTFRSTPTYNSPATIAYLLAADAAEIAAANNVTDVDPLPADTLVIVPVNCSCSGHSHRYQQHNASYVLKNLGETYFTVANNTYQSLSTCQSLIAQNPFDLRQLVPGMKLTVPLRCACPTPTQTAAGFRYLLTYLVRQGNSYDSIAADFAGAGADVRGILDANMLTLDSLIFFFTPILVPLKTPPTKENINTNTTTTTNTAASPPPPPAIPERSGGSNKWVFIGVGIGAAILLVLLFAVALVWFFRKKTKTPPPKAAAAAAEASPAPLLNNKWSEFSEGIRNAMETLTIYKIEELEKATNSFAESNRLTGSSTVYRGWFNGDEAAVKVMKGDVSPEIDALRQMNHSRIVRLSGYCLHHGTTYLVYEYAEQGSLSQWLKKPRRLDWKQRIQIAYDVADALNYLHNFTNPPYIHKNLTTSNVLLDGNMRAKLANFGLARALDKDDDMLTRHVVGAHGYMPPEYVESGLISPKLDVFAFGVIMLELLSGREAVVAKDDDDDAHRVLLLSRTVEEVLDGDNVREKLRGFMDPSLQEEYPLELAHSVAQLARACVAHDVDARPSVSDLFTSLSAIRSSSLDWDPSLDTSITFSE